MRKISPYAVIALSFLGIILIGTILLFLPISLSGEGSLSLTNAFFISTSAVTITGLSPVANLSIVLSPFGKIVLAVLIQIGGLSFVTISVFVMYLIGSKIGLNNRILIKESLNQNSLSGMVKLVIRIVIFTMAFELIGFTINLFVFVPEYGFFEAVGISAFHAISSFNNAGFDLLGSVSLQEYSGHILLNLNTAFMIMIGGLGFIVVNDIIEKKSYKKLMIHSKIVIFMNIVLWIGGTLLLKIGQINSSEKITWIEAFFLSISSRTAGFATIDIGGLTTLSTLILMILMFIGASPASTGGGLKTTTLYTLFKGVSSYATGNHPIAHKRLIDYETRQKATVLLTVSLTTIVISTLIIVALENTSLEQALFETISSFANVGLTKNMTVNLTNPSKIVLCIVMFIGRIGPLTMISLLNRKWHKKDLTHIEYIEEKIMIG